MRGCSKSLAVRRGVRARASGPFRHRTGTASWSASGAPRSFSVERLRSYRIVITDTPTYQRHFGRGFRVADHGRWIVREHAGDRLQVADVAVEQAEDREHGGLLVVML